MRETREKRKKEIEKGRGKRSFDEEHVDGTTRVSFSEFLFDVRVVYFVLNG